VAIVIVILRMLGLTEEMPLYHRRAQFSASGLRPRMTGETNRAWTEAKHSWMFGLPSMRSWSPPRATDMWSRIGRWRILTRTSTLGMFFMALIMVVGMRVGTGGQGASPVLLAFLVWMPSTMTTGVWINMWRFLEAESLRPICREAFLQEIGLTIAFDLLRGWLAMAILIAADAMLLANPRIGLSSVLTWTIASLLLQVLAYGVAITLMRYRSPMKAAMGTMLALMPPAIALTACAHEAALGKYHSAILAGSLLLAMLGYILIRDAYRRWRVTELG
jgi:hypothetical protein